MTRKMARIAPSYLLGLFFASYFDFKILSVFGTIVMGTALFCGVVGKNDILCICLIAAALAIFLYALAEVFIYNPLVAYSGKTVTISGRVEVITPSDSDRSSYVINGRIDGGPRGSFNVFADTLSCGYGDKITAVGVIEQPEDSYLFPAESYYKANGIFLQMSFPTAIAVTDSAGFSPKAAILSYRDYLYNKIVKILPGRDGAALVAMLCGDKTGLDDATKTLFFRAGIGHIMSVSGMHLTIVSSIVLWVLGRFNVGRCLSFVLLEIFILAFVLFAGMANSVLRSAVMLTCVYGAVLFKRRADSFSSLGVSVIALTVFTPFAVRDASFLLSVVGVFGIAVLAPRINSSIKWHGIVGKLGMGLVTSICVTFTVFPVSFLFFDEISVISPLSNLLLVPICSAALFCGFVVILTGGVTVIAYPLLLFAGLCCKIVLVACDFIGGLSFAYIPTGYGFLAVCMVIMLIGVVVAFFIYRRKSAAIFMALLSVPTMIIASVVYAFFNRDVLTIAILGDGKSSSLIVHDSANACVFDLKSGKNLPRVAQKYMTRLGVKKIDVLGMLSNGSESPSAYEKRLGQGSVGAVLVGEDSYLDTAFGKPVKRISDGTVIQMENYSIKLGAENTIEIRYGAFDFLAISGRKSADYGAYSGKAYSIVSIYDGKFAPPMEGGRALFLDEKAENLGIIPEKGSYGFLITCKKNGAVNLKEIKNGSRQ